MATITLTGRPCHHATIAIEPDCTGGGGPCDGECVCGGRWCHGDDPTAPTVMDWYWQHPAPTPDHPAAA